MASTDAVSAVCEALVHILRATMAAESTSLQFDSVTPKFEVYSAKDFSDDASVRHVSSGASIFLYRVLPNLTHRTPSGRLLPDGTRQRSQLPLDLHMIITIWGKDPSTQNRLAGWVMRTLEDYTSIPAAILNVGRDIPVFSNDETVELVIGEIGGEELLQLWDMLEHPDSYQLSIPYIARNVYIESHRVDSPAGEVQIRTLDMNRLVADS